MCSPTAALLTTSLIVGAATTGYQAYAQREAVKEQNAFISSQQEEGRRAADEAFKLQEQDLNAQAEEDREATRDELFTRRVEFIEQRSRANVASGEAGVGGRSINALFSSFQQQQDRREANIATNFGFRQDQRLRQLRGLDAQRRGRHAQVNSLRTSDSPSGVALGLRLLGGSVGTLNQFNSLTV